jgi:LacI family transcriptional regulator
VSTVYEVADRAGVSTATVSRVVHGSSLVRPDTRERVLAVIEELGYVPDGSAQGLSRRRKDIIGLAALERGVTEVGIEKNSPLFMDELVHAVESVLRGTDCSLLLTFGQAGEPFQRRIRSVSGKVDGLLVAEEVMPPGQLRALARRIPVVAIAGRRDETELDVVAVDNAAGVRALAAHLIEDHGYRRLGFLAGPADSPDARERLDAFRHAITQHPGCVLDPVPEGDFSEASGAAAARPRWRSGPHPRSWPAPTTRWPSVSCCSPGVRRGHPWRHGGDRLRRHLRQPRGDPGADHRGTAVPRARAPAAQRLRARIEDRELPVLTEILPTQCAIRASCGCPAPGFR